MPPTISGCLTTDGLPNFRAGRSDRCAGSRPAFHPSDEEPDGSTGLRPACRFLLNKTGDAVSFPALVGPTLDLGVEFFFRNQPPEVLVDMCQ